VRQANPCPRVPHCDWTSGAPACLPPSPRLSTAPADHCSLYAPSPLTGAFCSLIPHKRGGGGRRAFFCQRLRFLLINLPPIQHNVPHNGAEDPVSFLSRANHVIRSRAIIPWVSVVHLIKLKSPKRRERVLRGKRKEQNPPQVWLQIPSPDPP